MALTSADHSEPSSFAIRPMSILAYLSASRRMLRAVFMLTTGWRGT
jgi:hypothetical protein